MTTNKKTKLNDFKTQTISQIRLWAWAAAVLPISALAALFFVWRFFDGTVLGYVMITGESLMFTIAVAWWWWALYVMRNLVKHWDNTKENVEHVLHDVKDMKNIVVELLGKDK